MANSACASRALNYALRSVDLKEHDLIAFIDDDNVWRPDHIRSLLAVMPSFAASCTKTGIITTTTGVLLTKGSSASYESRKVFYRFFICAGNSGASPSAHTLIFSSTG